MYRKQSKRLRTEMQGICNPLRRCYSTLIKGVDFSQPDLDVTPTQICNGLGDLGQIKKSLNLSDLIWGNILKYRFENYQLRGNSI